MFPVRSGILPQKSLAKFANPNVWSCLFSAGEFLHLAGQIPSNLDQEMGDLARLAMFGFQCRLTLNVLSNYYSLSADFLNSLLSEPKSEIQ